MFKKKCELLFVDSVPSGRILCSLSNWDGICLRSPKSRLIGSSNIKELAPILHNTSIYFLVGGEPGQENIYIGETEDIYTRLKQHMTEDTWQEVYIITRKGNFLNKAHAKYLEHHFYEKAIEARRYRVLNKTVPTESSISDFDIADMAEFMHYVIMLVGLLGCKAFDSLKDKTSSMDDLFINSVGLTARAKILDNEFVVLKGSQSRADFKEASSRNLYKQWAGLRESGVIVDNIFVQDYSFSSPSSAAAVILGRNANGLTEWKNQSGLTLKKLFENVQ